MAKQLGLARVREVQQDLKGSEVHRSMSGVSYSLADISVSSGMYKEALEFMDIIDPKDIPQHMRSLYYGLLGHCYGEMAEYINLSYFSSEYKALAAEYRQRALQLTDEGTFFLS